MKKLTLFLLSLFTLTAILTGCGGQKAEAPKAAPVKELRVTYVKAPLNIPSIVDKFNETTCTWRGSVVGCPHHMELPHGSLG